MTIINASISAYQRSIGSGETRRRDAETPLAVNGKLEELVRDLKNSFIAKSGKRYGQFSESLGDYPFAAQLRQHLEGKSSFATLTKQFGAQFCLHLEAGDVEIDGHLLLVHESLADGDCLNLFFVQHSEGCFVGAELQLESSLSIEVSGVLLAAKIELTQWLESGDNGSPHYLCVLKTRGDKNLTDAFYQALGFVDKINIVEQTTHFLDAVSRYTQQMPEEQARETRSKVIDFCTEQDKAGKAISFNELSAEIDEHKPTAFSEYLAQNLKPSSTDDNEGGDGSQEVPQQLIADRKQLRQFVRISGRSDQLSMSFTSDCLGESIVYDPNSDSLTINNLPASLKARLLKHLQNQ